MTEMANILAALQGGGSAALIVSVIFIYKAADRLSRIEKALDAYMKRDEKRD
jgi:hypothetical protein